MRAPGPCGYARSPEECHVQVVRPRDEVCQPSARRVRTAGHLYDSLTVNAPNLRVSDAERNRVIESSSGTRPTAG